MLQLTPLFPTVPIANSIWPNQHKEANKTIRERQGVTKITLGLLKTIFILDIYRMLLTLYS